MVTFPSFKLSTTAQEANKIPILHLHTPTIVLKRRGDLSPQDTWSSTFDRNGRKYSAMAATKNAS